MNHYRGDLLAAQDRVVPNSDGYASDLDTPLLMFSEQDVWTLRDACEGVFITGGVGSGKTSGSGSAIARAYLKAGFGGIVCCATVNEADRWRRYCEETGRTQSLIVMDKRLAHRFNFLDYQMTVGRGSTYEAVNVLLDVLNAAEGRYDSGASRGGDQFWQLSTRQLLAMSLAPLWAAYGRITLPELMRFVHERPTRAEQLNPETGWIDRSFWARTIRLAERGGAHPIPAEDFEPVWNFWTSESDMMAADQRTAANIVKTLTGKLDPFLTGDLRRLFTTDSTFVPELTFHGAVIVLDLSAHEWGREGIFAQHIVKTMWQRAMQRRPKTETMRPAFCAADECQTFLAETDKDFTSMSRECRALNVYLTQNLPGIYAKLGQGSENVADTILGNLATKFFHAQPDARTAEWAATMIGKAVVHRRSVSENESEQTGSGTNTGRSLGGGQSSSQSGSSTNYGRGRGSSVSVNETIDYRLQPSHFTTLKKGGGADRMTEAVVFQAGRTFGHSGSTWTPVLFRQG